MWLARVTDHCIRDSIHHVILTNYDIWTFGVYSEDFTEINMTNEAMPVDSPSIGGDSIATLSQNISLIEAVVAWLKRARSETVATQGGIPLSRQAPPSLLEPLLQLTNMTPALENGRKRSRSISAVPDAGSSSGLPLPKRSRTGSLNEWITGTRCTSPSLASSRSHSSTSDRLYCDPSSLPGPDATQRAYTPAAISLFNYEGPLRAAKRPTGRARTVGGQAGLRNGAYPTNGTVEKKGKAGPAVGKLDGIGSSTIAARTVSKASRSSELTHRL